MNLNRFFALLLLLSISGTTLSAQNTPIKTIWEGKLGPIRLILRITEDSQTHQQTALFDSPDQGAMAIPVSKLKITNDSLYAYSASIGGGLSAAFNNDKTVLTGFWEQGGGKAPFVLKKVTAVSANVRPQMPKGPFPYQEEKVIYYNKDKSIQYGATLTIPNNAQNVPAVILITGSGPEDRDETIFGHKPFWVIADYLTRNGIAVLRVDDRGVGETTGDVMSATSADFAKDVLVGIDYLKTHKGINVKKIGLMGHSEGGTIASMVASQSTDVAFIVSLAGTAVKGINITKAQLRDAYTKIGLTADELNRMDSYIDMIAGLSKQHEDVMELGRAFQIAINDWVKQQPDELLTKVGFKGPNANRIIEQQVSQLFMPWMRFFMDYDPATSLTKIKIPLLALNGDKDVQVNARQNLTAFNTLLTQAGNKNFKTVSLPNLNHLFQHAVTGEVTEYAIIEETISPEVLDMITKWILSNTGKAK